MQFSACSRLPQLNNQYPPTPSRYHIYSIALPLTLFSFHAYGSGQYYTRHTYSGETSQTGDEHLDISTVRFQETSRHRITVIVLVPLAIASSLSTVLDHMRVHKHYLSHQGLPSPKSYEIIYMGRSVYETKTLKAGARAGRPL